MAVLETLPAILAYSFGNKHLEVAAGIGPQKPLIFLKPDRVAPKESGANLGKGGMDGGNSGPELQNLPSIISIFFLVEKS